MALCTSVEVLHDDDDLPPPKHYLGVTVSSTFTDLKEHRAALIKAIKAYG